MSPYLSADPRYEAICSKIIDLSNGDFTTVLNPSTEDDALDGIISVLNMLSDNWKERILHIPFIRKEAPSHYHQLFTIVLDGNHCIQTLSAFAVNMLCLHDINVQQQPIHKFASTHPEHQLQRSFDALIENPNQTKAITLYFHHVENPLKFDVDVQYCPHTNVFFLNFKCIRDIRDHATPEATSSKSRLQQHTYINSKIEKIYEYLFEEVEASKTTIEALCDKYGINEHQLKNKFKELYHTSVHQHKTDIRLKRCLKLVKETPQTFKSIALLAGYNDYSNFVRTFKKKYGASPKKIRAAK